MSIEEVERILDETQEAVEYQRVGVAMFQGPASHQPARTVANLVTIRWSPLRIMPSQVMWWPPLLK